MLLNVIGDQQCLKLTGQDTNQLFTLIEQTNEPSTGVPRHVHTHEDEVFEVLAGAVEFTAGDHAQVLHAGELVYLPRGTAHSFRVVGDTTARVLLSVFPAGIEGMFQELGQLPAGPPDFGRVAEIMQPLRNKLVGAAPKDAPTVPMPDLCSKLK